MLETLSRSDRQVNIKVGGCTDPNKEHLHAEGHRRVEIEGVEMKGIQDLGRVRWK